MAALKDIVRVGRHRRIVGAFFPGGDPTGIVPVICNPTLYKSQYAIQNYFNGYIPASTCAACQPGGITDPWDGIFRENLLFPCSWNEGTGLGFNDIDGKAFVSATLVLNLGLSWDIDMTCFDGIGFTSIWAGTKLTGWNPRGIYFQTGGCVAAPASLRII